MRMRTLAFIALVTACGTLAAGAPANRSTSRDRATVAHHWGGGWGGWGGWYRPWGGYGGYGYGYPYPFPYTYPY